MVTTRQDQIASERQRQLVPAIWQVGFQTWSDDALLSLNEDERVPSDVRSFAGWELDYRMAFDKKSLPEKQLPKVDRSRWTFAGAEAEIRRRMEEQD